jgi:hypothetical protein
MGANKRKRKTVVDAPAEPAESTCPVCFSEFDRPEGLGGFDTVLHCANKHMVCLECVAKMMKYTGCKGGHSCTQFGYTCPICRSQCCLKKLQMLVLACRSWTALVLKFDPPELVEQYMQTYS